MTNDGRHDSPKPPAVAPAIGESENLWTADDLAAFLGVKPRTVTEAASRFPHRLPPRVRHMTLLRWVPSICREWALAGSLPPAAATPPRRRGRPRKAWP